MATLAARTQLAALVAVQVLAVVLLHALAGDLAVDWGDPAGWLAATPPADAAVAALRYAGLAAGWWLLAGTGVYALARAARLPAAAAAAARLTLPAVRRVVDRAVATGAAASLLLAGPAPALADPVAPPPAAAPPVLEAQPEGTTAAPLGTATEAIVAPPVAAPPAGVVVPPPLAAPATEDGPARRPRAAAGADDADGVHVVAAGEHLWGIAATAVTAAKGRADVSAAEIAPYWVRLVAANRERLRSGDPDLIFPGERIVLPALEQDP